MSNSVDAVLPCLNEAAALPWVLSRMPTGYRHAGLEAATASVACFLDADGSFGPAQLPRVVDPVMQDRADVVSGRRRPTTVRARPVRARIGNAVRGTVPTVVDMSRVPSG